MRTHEDYQVRMIEEKIQLESRLERLSTFIARNELFRTLSTLEQTLMKEQQEAMTKYLGALSARIGLFTS